MLRQRAACGYLRFKHLAPACARRRWAGRWPAATGIRSDGEALSAPDRLCPPALASSPRLRISNCNLPSYLSGWFHLAAGYRYRLLLGEEIAPDQA